MIVLPRAAIARHSDLLYTNFLIPVNHTTIPIVLEWDFFVFGPPSERKLIERWLNVPAWFVRRVSAVVVRHELSRLAFAERYPEDASKAVVVPHYLPGVEPLPVVDVNRKFDELTGKGASVLFVGNESRRKGLPTLLEAYRNIQETRRGVRLTVVSDFRDGPVAIPPGVVVLSRLSPRDVRALMAEAHIFAMPTRRDAIGMVFAEAMAHGCALLVPDRSPQRELFGGYGVRATPDDPKAVTEALAHLLDNSTLALDYALRARQAFVDRLYHRTVGEQYWHLLQRTARTGACSRRQTLS
jgi:glycosyltransferase involved in cell wall biosynthesis